MGRNSAIKHFNATPEGQPMNLFPSKGGRLPVIVELLRSPWIFRASDLARDEDAGLGKRTTETVAVAWDDRRHCPSAFEWRSRTYRIDAIVQVWAIERHWWDASSRLSRRVWRVLARGGTYDLAYDRLTHTWYLVGFAD